MQISASAVRIGQLFSRVPGALPAVLAAAMFAPAAQAVPVVSTAANVSVPLTTAGVYINVVSGVSNGVAASVSGWDINLWGTTTSGSALNFFNAALPTGTVPSAGSYVASVLGQVASLSPGTVVGPSTPLFGSGQATTTAASSPWVLNSINYFGFRFGGDDGLLHYGYGTVIIGASLQQRTIGNLFYESAANTAITVTAVPEPSSVAMMLLGAGALGAVALRRRRQTEQ